MGYLHFLLFLEIYILDLKIKIQRINQPDLIRRLRRRLKPVIFMLDGTARTVRYCVYRKYNIYCVGNSFFSSACRLTPELSKLDQLARRHITPQNTPIPAGSPVQTTLYTPGALPSNKSLESNARPSPARKRASVSRPSDSAPALYENK